MTVSENSSVLEFKLLSLLEFIKPHKNILLLALSLMLGESAISLLNPWLAGQFTGSFIQDGPTAEYTYRSILLIWLSVLAVQAVFNFGNRYLLGLTGERCITVLRTRLYDHIQALPLPYFHDRKRGAILSLLTNDTEIVSYFVTSTAIWIVPQLVTLSGALIMIFWIDATMAVIIGFLIPLFYLIMKVLGRKIRPLTNEMLDEYAGMLAIVDENLQMHPAIKSFTREAAESNRFKESNSRLLNLTGRYLRTESMLSPIVHFLAAATILLLLFVGTAKIESAELALPQLVSLLFYGMLLTRPVSGLADLYGQIQHTRGAVDRLADVFSVEPEPADGEGGQILTSAKGDIEFVEVHFSYPGREPTLCGLNLKISAGETVAITGKNGAGKSTLAYLLQRFADPTSGQILIDNTPIATVSLTSLRQQIGVVSQHVLLLNDTIEKNILFGRPEADQPAIESAAKAAHALEFIEALPDGFDTLIGDEGIKLSGGQKQRIALARSIVRDPPILILDEATAMFDPAGEMSFIRECHDILHQRTVILITHRPASLSLADRVLKLENGVIVNANEV